MLLKVFNSSIVKDREKTFLTFAGTAGDTTLTVADTDLVPAATSSDTWSDNDYVLVGSFGDETTEIMQVAAAVSSATSITIDRSGSGGGLRFAHPIGTPIYKLSFNQAEFSRSATNTTAGVSVLTTIRLQPDDLYTRFEDVTNVTGFGFVRFKNETTGSFSSYSDGVNYEVSGQGSSQDPRTLWMLRKKVRGLLDEQTDNKLKDEQIDAALNDGQRDLAHLRLWSFFEEERSFSIVTNQFAYDIPSTIQKSHSVRFNTQPLAPMNKTTWDSWHFNTDSSSDNPSHVCIWNNQFLIYPRPSISSSTTTLNGAISSATAGTITVSSTTAFNRGDYFRFIIDSEVIYATGSTATTFTGCLRGKEGTTATTHSDLATVTERDIVYNGHVEPTDLIDTQDRTPVPEAEIIALQAAITLAPICGKVELVSGYEGRYERKVKLLEAKYLTKQSGYFGRVKAPEEVVTYSRGSLLDPNRYPKNIT